MNIAGPVALAKGVAAFFAVSGVTAKVDFGWKARSKILNQGPGGANRVVFMPGKVPADTSTPRSIEAGLITQPRKHNEGPRGNPRALRQFRQWLSISVWGVAPAGYTGDQGLGDEAAQYAATLDLLELTLQAINGAVFVDPAGGQWNVGLADAVYESAQWVEPPVEMGFGRELLVYVTHSGPLYDVQTGQVTPQPAVARNPAS